MCELGLEKAELLYSATRHFPGGYAYSYLFLILLMQRPPWSEIYRWLSIATSACTIPGLRLQQELRYQKTLMKCILSFLYSSSCACSCGQSLVMNSFIYCPPPRRCFPLRRLQCIDGFRGAVAPLLQRWGSAVNR